MGIEFDEPQFNRRPMQASQSRSGAIAKAFIRIGLARDDSNVGRAMMGAILVCFSLCAVILLFPDNPPRVNTVPAGQPLFK